ncbi:MAG: hypothetical protein ACREJN_06815, partial [Nitrospiraceae bacterium]
MRRSCIIVVALLLSVYCAFSQVITVGGARKIEPPPKNENTEIGSLVQSMLGLSHAMATQLSPKDGVELLVHLADVAGKKNSEEARQWNLEALRLARDMTAGRERAHYEGEIIRGLASVDSTAALVLLPTLEFPLSWEDDCNDGTIAAVFQGFLQQHPDDWERLATVAEGLGESGKYPFDAVQILVRQIEGKHPEMATSLVQQAIQFYNVSAHDPCSNNRMAALLARNSELIPGSSMKAAVESLLSNLSNGDHGSLENRSGSDPSLDQKRLSSLEQSTVNMLMALINSLDPQMAQKLKQKQLSADSTAVQVADAEGGGNSVQSGGTITAMDVTVVLSSLGDPAQLTAPQGPPNIDGAMSAIQSTSAEELAGFLESSKVASENDQDPEQQIEVLLERGLSLASANQPAELSNVLGTAFTVGEK